ncbi:hypothetical protein SAMN05216241_11065 [Limimonas halophila]|uniref:ACT domain-containing protein n=1 Tax=Limimonas halophila TaxID=1082479 RepID=A0A1G7TT68_9PROT|nr:hypothetical protein [Limimonas halophila]SDG38468.1 hypothetical protein SAMN05216241_11065 [Limimonas halophila]
MRADPSGAAAPSQATASAPHPHRVTCFAIRACADPGLMPRVLEVFAKRSLTPERWHADRMGPERDELAIDVQVADLSQHESAFLARLLRQIWGVEAVLTSDKDFA